MPLKKTNIEAKSGLDWENSDIFEVMTEAAFRLRQTMQYSEGACEVTRLVNAKLLELLWCPLYKRSKPRIFWKDVIRDDLTLVGVPHNLWKEACNGQYNKQICPQCHSSELLARVLLGPMDSLFDSHKDRNGRSLLLWVVAKLHDQLGRTNSYRTLSGMKREDDAFRIFQLLYRMPEADYEWFNEWMVDFSALLRDTEEKEEIDYCLVCKTTKSRGYSNEYRQVQEYNVAEIINILKKEIDIDALRGELALLNNKTISNQLAQNILTKETQRYRDQAPRYKNPKNKAGVAVDWLDSEVVNKAFAVDSCITDTIKNAKVTLQTRFFERDKKLPAKADHLKRTLCELLYAIQRTFSLKLEVEADEAFLSRLANYFIWLSTLHPELGSYTVRYSANYRLLPGDTSGATNKQNRLRNPCFVIASREVPSSHLLAVARVSLTHVLGPLEDYYARIAAIIRGEKEGIASVERRLGHEISKAYLPVYNFFKESETFENQIASAALKYGMITAPTKSANEIISPMQSDEIIRLAWRIFILRDIFGETFSKEIMNQVLTQVQHIWTYVPAVEGSLLTSHTLQLVKEDLRMRLAQLQYILLTNAIKHHYKEFYFEKGSNPTPALLIDRFSKNIIKQQTKIPFCSIKVSTSVIQSPLSGTWRATIEVKNVAKDMKNWEWEEGTPQAIDNTCRIFYEVANNQQYEHEKVIRYDCNDGWASIRCELQWGLSIQVATAISSKWNVR